MENIKHIKAQQHCSICNKELHSQMIIAPVPVDFKISDISFHVVENIDKKTCKQHPEAVVSITHTHHHKEIIN